MTELLFVPLDGPETTRWLAETRAGYIDELIAAGNTEAEAATNADRSIERLFPGGAPSPGQRVGAIVHDGARIGELWIGPAGDDPERWWVWNIVINEAHRGKGFGRATMELAEKIAGDAGATSIGLNVFASNEVARHLYRALGYEETSIQMRKSVAASHTERESVDPA